MNRPRVICHMASTVDGRILAEHWGSDLDKFVSLYQECHETFDSQAWMVGRVTMEKDFTQGRKPKRTKPDKPIARVAYVGDKNATSYAVALDPRGKLGWNGNEIEGDHIIEILTESVKDTYLHHLRQNNISYIFAGRETIDLRKALQQLHKVFGIKTLMLEGGGHINGSFLKEGLIDELSLLIVPLADGMTNAPTTFEAGSSLKKKTKATSLRLTYLERMDHDVLWVKYEL